MTHHDFFRAADRLLADPDRIVRLLELHGWHVLSGECGWLAITVTGRQVHAKSPEGLLHRIAKEP
jgi:hypothetical protein